MTRAEYTKYLQSKHWIRFRTKAILHYGKECIMCGIKEVPYFHVHHLTYERIGKEEFEDVAVLCKSCHSEVHKTGFVVKHDIKDSLKNKFVEHKNWAKGYKRFKPKKNKTKRKPLPVVSYIMSEEELQRYK